MRLLRIGNQGEERPTVLQDGVHFDLSPLTSDIDGTFLSLGGIERVREALTVGRLEQTDVDGARVGAPIARPGTVICVGLNYKDHAAESGMVTPDEPVLFQKASNTVVGPNDRVLIPRNSEKADYEVELGVVIGGRARYLASPADAQDVITGYAVSHDVSERAFQLERGGTWDKGKSCETFNPLGPWLVTADELADPQALGLRLWVNGELRQNGTTADMIFSVQHLVWYVSQFMVLDPGDLLNTGTPAGVAFGENTFPYLSQGDVVELEIDGLGHQRQVLEQA